jgi:GntR family transcriptional repressor for pyruvate dehydrogenase complex
MSSTTTTSRRRQSSRLNNRPKKTAMLLAQKIVGEITDDGLESGTPLPPESQMLAEYGVARGTLREALRFLEIQGVITIKTGPGGGPVVGQADSRALGSMIAMLLQMHHTPFRAIVEARQVIEPVLAAKAALRVETAELVEIHNSILRMEENLDDLDFFLEENQNFHSLLALAAGNQVFGLMIQSLNWITDGSPLGVDYPRAQRESVTKEHRRIYHAVESHDPEQAEASMRVHLGDFARYLDRYYASVMDAPVRWEQVSG